MVVTRRRSWLVSLLVALLLAAPVWVRVASSQTTAPDGITVDDLRAGGYVIFFRHGTADQGVDATPVDPDDCDTQRNLSEAGLRDARAIGQAFRKLAIPYADVYSSEFCRAIETARVAFGRNEPLPWLDLCCNDTRPYAGDERAALLAQALATPPPEGMNTIIVAHGEGINADLAMGEAAIYRPDGHGGFARVARVKSTEWMSGVYRLE